jgi:tetratricopeptide (TPR) repeat protein
MLAMAESPSEVNNQAVSLYREGRYAEAEQRYKTALEAWKQTPESDRDQAITLNNMAVLYRTAARFEEARTAQRDALRQLRAVEGARGAAVAMALVNLGDIERLLGNLTAAESAAREALEIYRVNGEQGPNAASAMQALASIEIERQHLSEARRLLDRALEIREKTLGPSHAFTGSIWSSLATLEIANRNFAAAEAAARKALAIARESKVGTHPTVATCVNNLAQALRFQNRYLEAEPLYREAISIWESALGRSHPDTARGLINLAAFYHDRGRESGAETLYARARDVLSHSLGAQHPMTLMAASGLADVYRAQRRFTEARKLWRSVLPAMEGMLATDDPRLAEARISYGRLVAEDRPVSRPRHSLVN